MRNLLVGIALTLTLSACATPVAMLKNEKTGQVARCGGDSNGSMIGGVIGYNIQKSNDEKCVADYEAQGFKHVEQPQQ